MVQPKYTRSIQKKHLSRKRQDRENQESPLKLKQHKVYFQHGKDSHKEKSSSSSLGFQVMQRFNLHVHINIKVDESSKIPLFPSNLDFLDSIIVENIREFGEKENLFHNLFLPDDQVTHPYFTYVEHLERKKLSLFEDRESSVLQLKSSFLSALLDQAVSFVLNFSHIIMQILLTFKIFDPCRVVAFLDYFLSM